VHPRAEARVRPQPRPVARPLPGEVPARQPLFWAALAFIGGIWIGPVAWRPPAWWLVAVVVFVGAAVYFLRRRPWFARGLTLGACVLMGAFAVQAPTGDSTPLWLGDGREVTVTAHVTAEGNLEEESPGAWQQRIDAETEQMASDLGTNTEIAEAEPRRFADEAPGTKLFRYVERLRFTTTLNPPRNFGNPGAFDYVVIFVTWASSPPPRQSSRTSKSCREPPAFGEAAFSPAPIAAS
jgi:hypothetical protein